MQTQALYDFANARTAPLTEALIQRQPKYHRIATLGHNKIIRDYHTQTLIGRERVTRLLPRPSKSKSLWRSIVDLIVGKKRAVIGWR